MHGRLNNDIRGYKRGWTASQAGYSYISGYAIQKTGLIETGRKGKVSEIEMPGTGWYDRPVR